MDKEAFPTTSYSSSSYSYISKLSSSSSHLEKRHLYTSTQEKAYSSILPGRIRRRKYSSPSSGTTHVNYLLKSFRRMIRNRFITRWKVHLVVLSWYILGCVSITTTKILLRDWGVTPMNLTCQQLFIGGCTLYAWISLHLSGGTTSTATATTAYQGKWDTIWYRPRKMTLAVKYLYFTAICFAFGFYTTNRSFFGSHASFVETIKAAEPITSATVAYLWGIEGLSRQELFSLLGMCTGVVVSTVGNALLATSTSSTMKVLSPGSPSSALSDSFLSTSIVLVSNLCFSFRGLFQKLLRSYPEGSLAILDDIHLQLRIQQIGFVLFLGPIIIVERKQILGKFIYLMGLSDSSSFQYIGLSIINGIAFASYK